MTNEILNFSEEVGWFSHQQTGSVKDSHLTRKARPLWAPSLKHREDKGTNVMLWQNTFILTYSWMENVFHTITSCYNQQRLNGWLSGKDHQCERWEFVNMNGGERRRETWEIDWSNQNSAETSLCIPKTSVWAWPMGFSVTAAVSGLSLFSPTLSRRTMLLHFSRWRRRGGSHLPTQSHQWPLTWRVMQTLSQTGHGWNTSNTPWMQLWLLTSISALKAAEVFFSYLPGVLCTRIHVA